MLNIRKLGIALSFATSSVGFIACHNAPKAEKATQEITKQITTDTLKAMGKDAKNVIIPKRFLSETDSLTYLEKERKVSDEWIRITDKAEENWIRTDSILEAKWQKAEDKADKYPENFKLQHKADAILDEITKKQKEVFKEYKSITDKAWEKYKKIKTDLRKKHCTPEYYDFRKEIE